MSHRNISLRFSSNHQVFLEEGTKVHLAPKPQNFLRLWIQASQGLIHTQLKPHLSLEVFMPLEHRHHLVQRPFLPLVKVEFLFLILNLSLDQTHISPETPLSLHYWHKKDLPHFYHNLNVIPLFARRRHLLPQHIHRCCHQEKNMPKETFNGRNRRK